MPVLLIADHDGERLDGATGRALTAALQVGGKVDLLVAGDEGGATREVAAAAARLGGIRRVLLAVGPSLRHRTAESMTDLIMGLAPGYDAFIAAASSAGKDLMPRIAARLDVMQVSEVVEVVAPDTFRRPIHAGNALQTVRATDPQRVLTIRTSAFAATPEGEAVAPIETVAAPADPGLSALVEQRRGDGGRPDLGSARVVVSGGRAFGSAEEFGRLILPLVDALGAAVGASRAAVDSGAAPGEWQVGQTGRIVAPELYIACGISGAVQHLAGMRESRVIVAINRDPLAPIFEVADYGLVGDVATILPDLTRAVRARRPG